MLYVATTRAKNALVISSFSEDSQDDNKNPWQPLLKEIKPEMLLEIPDRDSTKLVTKTMSYGLEEYQTHMYKREKVKKKLFTRSYLESTVTRQEEFSEVKSSLIPTVDKGGKKWGNAVHEILEQVVSEETEDGLLKAHIIETLKRNNIDLSRKDELYGIVRRFVASDLFQRIKNARQKYTEIPFNLKIVPSDPFYQEFILEEREKTGEERKPLILTGTIDLIFQEADGWVVVDYKTDCPVKQSDYAKLRQLYEVQISTYCKIWNKISSERVKESLIYFVSE